MCSMDLPSRLPWKALVVRRPSTPNHGTQHAPREMAEWMSTTARNTILWMKSAVRGARRALQGHDLLTLLLILAMRRSLNFPLPRALMLMNRVRAPRRLRRECRTHEQCAIHLKLKLKSKLITVKRTIPRTGQSRDTGVQRSARGAVHLQTSPGRKPRSRLPLSAQSLCQATRQAPMTAVTVIMMMMMMNHQSTIHQRTRPRLPEVRQTVLVHTMFTAMVSIRSLQMAVVCHRYHGMKRLSIERMLSSKAATSPARGNLIVMMIHRDSSTASTLDCLYLKESVWTLPFPRSNQTLIYSRVTMFLMVLTTIYRPKPPLLSSLEASINIFGNILSRLRSYPSHRHGRPTRCG